MVVELQQDIKFVSDVLILTVAYQEPSLTREGRMEILHHLETMYSKSSALLGK
jgi:hypothetical protein